LDLQKKTSAVGTSTRVASVVGTSTRVASVVGTSTRVPTTNQLSSADPAFEDPYSEESEHPEIKDPLEDPEYFRCAYEGCKTNFVEPCQHDPKCKDADGEAKCFCAAHLEHNVHAKEVSKSNKRVRTAYTLTYIVIYYTSIFCNLYTFEFADTRISSVISNCQKRKISCCCCSCSLSLF
jgi:hypothetical protein